jgi:hypothetical protein
MPSAAIWRSPRATSATLCVPGADTIKTRAALSLSATSNPDQTIVVAGRAQHGLSQQSDPIRLIALAAQPPWLAGVSVRAHGGIGHLAESELVRRQLSDAHLELRQAWGIGRGPECPRLGQRLE